AAQSRRRAGQAARGVRADARRPGRRADHVRAPGRQAGGRRLVPLDTSARSPVPVRTVLQLVGGWISRLGRVWVEGQIAELAVRGGAVFLTLRDPVAAASLRVSCSS